MGYCAYMTKAGYALQAKLFAEGGDLEVTRVEVGSGILPAETDWRTLTDLAESRARATSTKPLRQECTVSLEIEFRSDLDSGVEEPFQINEFGLWAIGSEGEEALILYGDLSDCPDTAVPLKCGGCVRRYPVVLEIGPDANVSLSYPAGAWVTHEEAMDLVRKTLNEELCMDDGATFGEAIAAKQDTLTGRRGQVVGFDASGAAAAVEGWSGWNFVDNGGFDIWRNGTVLDADGWMCTADRWNNDSQKCRYERVDNPFPDCQCRYAMKVTNLADGQWASICQPIEPDLAAALDGRTVTLSVWVMGQSDQKFGISAGTVSEGRVFSLSDQPQYVSVTGVFRDQADKSLNRILALIDGPAGAKAGDWYIAAGLKLELGDAATPYTPRGMPLEYAVCSQYSAVTGEWDGFRHSNLNLLVNWYFEDPINQLGQTVYTGVGYTVDRWRSESDLRVTLEDGWLKVANETDGVGWFVQFAEPSLLKALAGKTVTSSALCKAEGVSATMYYGYTDNGVWTSPIDTPIPVDGNAHITQLTHLTPDATNPTTFQSTCFCLAAHSTLWIKAAKLELGCQQTLAHQDAEGNWVLNDPPPDRALELAKCQRYFQVFSSSALRPAKAGDFRPPMRVNPALGTIVIDGVTYYTADANL